MRTPDEIKKGLECCKPIWKNNHWKTCDRNCPYAAEAVNCRLMLSDDAIAHISQLESQNRCFKEIKESCERRMIDMAQRMTNWISVEERLPEEVGAYVVYGNSRIAFATFYPSVQMWVSNVDSEINYWMPLPEPPPEN